MGLGQVSLGDYPQSVPARTEYVLNPVEIDPKKRYVMVFPKSTTDEQVKNFEDSLRKVEMANIVIAIGAMAVMENKDEA